MQRLYKSTGYIDELAWAAAWLYKATREGSYLADAKNYYGQVRTQSRTPHMPYRNWTQASWSLSQSWGVL